MGSEEKYQVKEVTPEAMRCAIGACPKVYAARDAKVFDKYLIIGKQVNPQAAGLEGKVGEGEAMIEVPRGLIDGMEEKRVQPEEFERRAESSILPPHDYKLIPDYHSTIRD